LDPKHPIDEELVKLVKKGLVVYQCHCVECDRHFLVDAGEIMMVTYCPFCGAKIDYTPLVRMTERVQ